MRLITKKEAKQRGCVYCKDIKRYIVKRFSEEVNNTIPGKGCPYAKCPYTVMDEYETYEDYCKTLGKRFAEEFGVFV